MSRSPYAAAARLRPPQRGAKSLLVAVSKLLERQAGELHGLAVVLAAFEQARFFTPASAKRYAALANSTAFVVALGAGMPPERHLVCAVLICKPTTRCSASGTSPW